MSSNNNNNDNNDNNKSSFDINNNNCNSKLPSLQTATQRDLFSNLSQYHFENEIYDRKLYNKYTDTEFQLRESLVKNIGLDYIIPYSIDTKCPFWISWSPDNTHLAITTNDSLDIFEANSGQMLYNITDHSQVVSMVAWFNRPYTNYIEVNEDFSSSNITDKTTTTSTTTTTKPKVGSASDISPHIRKVTSKHTYKNTLTSQYNSFISCSLDNTIKIYQDYKLKATLTEHKDWLKSIAISSDDQLLLSGCASSGIYGWDLNTGTVKFRINKAHPQTTSESSNPSTGVDLNTINSLKMHHFDSNIFISGSRYGSFRMWDCRTPQMPIFHIQAHHNKLNILHFSYDEQNVLTSGRDGAIKLWDVRAIASDPSTKVNSITGANVEVYKKGLLKEYRGHKCSGYNISCSFINNDRQIISGSEDYFVYVYDTLTAKVIKKILSHKSAVHLVAAANGKGLDALKVATGSIDNCNIHIYSPQMLEEDEKTQSISSKFVGVTPPDEKDTANDIKVRSYVQRITMEKLMMKFGDQLFQFYHKHNLPPSVGTNNPEFLTVFRKIEKQFAKQFVVEAKRIGNILGKSNMDLTQLLDQDINPDDFERLYEEHTQPIYASIHSTGTTTTPQLDDDDDDEEDDAELMNRLSTFGLLQEGDIFDNDDDADQWAEYDDDDEGYEDSDSDNNFPY
ncbi:hypothetical protein CYY_001122 [Polysphondylium violaceum]|uniref:WD40 repeat-containing protein n=1 Tax=Polysphondylium violaceum TaxID=133409 RepID=A0A8J4UWI7_9MYCE|nr:hypothetical protein CYY_001122 [Polysphondylium violaceum]